MICHWLTNNHNTISMCFWKYWELQVSTKSNRENLKFGDCFVITTLHSNPSIWGHLVTRSWFQNMPRCLHLYHEFNEFLSLNIGWEFMTILKGDGPHEVASSHMLTWQSQTEQPMEKPMKNQLQSVKLCYSEDVWGSLSALKSSREISIRNTSHVQQHVK